MSARYETRYDGHLRLLCNKGKVIRDIRARYENKER